MRPSGRQVAGQNQAVHEGTIGRWRSFQANGRLADALSRYDPDHRPELFNPSMSRPQQLDEGRRAFSIATRWLRPKLETRLRAPG